MLNKYKTYLFEQSYKLSEPYKNLIKSLGISEEKAIEILKQMDQESKCNCKDKG